MRSYKKRDIELVRSITRPFSLTHGEPIEWGWDALTRLGVNDIDLVDWGDAPVTAYGEKFAKTKNDVNRFGVSDEDAGEDEVPVFWGCGVTPQEAVIRAGDRIEGLVIGHMPGHMLLLDVSDEKVSQ